MAEGLKIFGESSNVVDTICPLAEIELTDLPKSGGGGGERVPPYLYGSFISEWMNV